jgi:type VI secretion system protein VasJ
MIGRGTVDEDTLEPPSTELRMAMRRAWLGNDWFEVLENSERAMASTCGGCWLDVQHYSHKACRELGYDAVAHAIRGMTAAYLQAVPDITSAVMLDGSPTASPDTQAWIRTEVLTDPRKAREESLEEVRQAETFASFSQEVEPDAFDVAAGELGAGRFDEAFRVLSEALVREQTGRGRLQRKIQLAKICMEGDQRRVALPLLKEISNVIEERRLDMWESPEFVAAPLAMLYRCLGRADEDPTGENEAAQRRIYDRICATDPRKALELVTQR